MNGEKFKRDVEQMIEDSNRRIEANHHTNLIFPQVLLIGSLIYVLLFILLGSIK
jgi:hypothetical protein